MSSARGPWIALGTAALLGLVYWGWMVKLKPQREQEKEDAKLLFKGLDAAGTDQIVLRKKGSADVELRKIDNQWRLISPTAAPADQDAVTTLVNQLATAKRNEIIVEKDADFRQFGLDQPSGAVTFQPSSPGAKAQILYFGMDSPVGAQAYAVIDGKPEVFLTYLSVKNAVLKDAPSLRDKAVWSFNSQDVEAVKDGIDGFNLSRDKNGMWQVDTPKRHEPGKGDAVDGWLGNLSRLKADSVPSETGKGNFGLASGKRLELTMKNGSKLALLEGAKVVPTPAPVRPGSKAPPPAAATGSYVQVAGFGPVFQLSASTVQSLEKKAQDLMDLNVFKMDTGAVARFEVERPKGKLSAVKKDGVWSWEQSVEMKPGDKPFDFYGFLSTLANTQLTRRLDLKKDSPAAPQASVAFYGEGGALVEKAVFGPKREGGQVAVSAMKNQAVLAPDNLLNNLPPDVPRGLSPSAAASPGAKPGPAPAPTKVAPQPVPGAGR